MDSKISLVDQTIVTRLLHELILELKENGNMVMHGEMTIAEMHDQILLLEPVYATKILQAVLQ